MGEERVLTCVYCGMQYPQDTPAWGNQILTDHIKVCEKHPLRKVEAEKSILRKALIGLVGAETRLELEGMKQALTLLPIPSPDLAVTLNAIQALIDTQEA